MRRLILVALSQLALASPVQAADLTLAIRDTVGRPVKDAVVTVRPAAGTPVAPIRFTWPYSVAQQNIQFNPSVLIVPVGSTVTFPNKDNVRHHVYSFSPVKKFELKLYGRDESRSVLFDKPGIVPLGCNIHDQMIAYVVVVDTPFAGKTTTDGTLTLKGLPATTVNITVWHPYLKSARNQIVKAATLGPAGLQLPVSLDLRPAPSGHEH